ncbi:MAG: FecR domain-containing protein [Oceanidesulfovibrio sp.]
MRCLRLLAPAVAFLSIALALPAAAAEKTAGVTQIADGKVLATLQQERDLYAHLPVFVGEHIQTFENSSAQFMLTDGSMLTMAAMSKLTLDNVSFAFDGPDDRQSMQLGFGEGLFRFATGGVARDNPEGVNARTRLLGMGIRGTEVGVSVDPSGDVVAVLEGGPVDVTDQETREVFTISEGQAVSKSAGQPATVGPVPQELLKRLEEIRIDLSPPPLPPSAGGGC